MHLLVSRPGAAPAAAAPDSSSGVTPAPHRPMDRPTLSERDLGCMPGVTLHKGRLDGAYIKKVRCACTLARTQTCPTCMAG